MTNEELVIRIKAGIDTADNMALLYEQNSGFIFKIAKRYCAFSEMDDLMQEGYLGLCEAVEHFESDQGIKFLTYGEYWIKQVIQRYIDNNSNTVRIPIHSRNRIIKYKKFISLFYSKYNRKPTDKEISRHLMVSVEIVEKIKKDAIMTGLASLDSPLSNGEEELCIGDSIASPDNIEELVIDDIYDKQIKEDLWQFVNDTLDENEQKIVVSRYCENRSRQNIGDELGMSCEWVRKKESKALRRLRHGAKARAFRDKYEQELCYAWRGSVGTFKTTWTSSTEYVALRLMEQ